MSCWGDFPLPNNKMERITEDINFANEYSASQASTLSSGGRGRGREQNYLAGIHDKIMVDVMREWGALITLDSSH